MILIYIIGPSSSGKDSLQNYLVNKAEDVIRASYAHYPDEPRPTIRKLPLYTTRPMRETESEGNPYHFISQYEFYYRRNYDKLVAPKYFLETRTYNFIDNSGMKTLVHYATGIPQCSDTSAEIYVGVGTYESLQSIVRLGVADEIWLVKLRVSREDMMKRYFQREIRTPEREAELLRRMKDDEERDRAYYDDSHKGIPDDHYIVINNSFKTVEDFLHQSTNVILRAMMLG